MSQNDRPTVGAIAWHDLTVPDATNVRTFYEQVVGWKTEPVSQGDYNDYNVKQPDSGETVAGICHARGVNANLPPQWMIYIIVEDLDDSLRKCAALGGKIVDGPRSQDGGKLCIIQDPAGAVAALYQP